MDTLLRDAGIARCIAAAMVAISISACTVVHIESPEVETRLYAGVLRIEPIAGADAIAYRSTGFGLVPGHNGATLGFAKEDVVAMRGDACRIVLFRANEDRTANLRAILSQAADPKDICEVGE